MQKTIADEIVQYIPVGSENAISRAALRCAIGLDDRATRDAVHKAREAGYMICSSGRGYFIGAIDDIEKQYWREKHRIAKTYAAIRQMRSYLKENGRKV